MKIKGYNVKIYDNGGETFDRYTACYLDFPEPRDCVMVMARGMSENPYHPQGFGQMTAAQDGPHLGKEIAFEDLPEPCQRLILSDLD